MTDNFPHSPEYFERQASRQKALGALREKMTWTDAQWLAERDVAYVAQQRSHLRAGIINSEQEMKDDNDPEGYIRYYGTDEG